MEKIFYNCSDDDALKFTQQTVYPDSFTVTDVQTEIDSVKTEVPVIKDARARDLDLCRLLPHNY